MTYIILQLYNDPTEYSSANGKVAIFRASCETIEDAAEIIARKRINELNQFRDQLTSGRRNPAPEQLFVIEVPTNTMLDPMTIPRVPITESHLSESTRNELHAVLTDYNQRRAMLSGGHGASQEEQSRSNHLTVDPNAYERDRHAREYEFMQRLHVQPIMSARRPVPTRPVVVTQSTRPESVVAATQNQAVPGTVPSYSVGNAAQPVTTLPATQQANPGSATTVPVYTAQNTPSTPAVVPTLPVVPTQPTPTPAPEAIATTSVISDTTPPAGSLPAAGVTIVQSPSGNVTTTGPTASPEAVGVSANSRIVS